MEKTSKDEFSRVGRSSKAGRGGGKERKSSPQREQSFQRGRGEEAESSGAEARWLLIVYVGAEAPTPKEKTKAVPGQAGPIKRRNGSGVAGQEPNNVIVHDVDEEN
jgi:hypothetical protein